MMKHLFCQCPGGGSAILVAGRRTALADSRNRSTGRSALGAVAILSLGLETAVAALGGLYLGSLLDRSRPTPLFAPLGLLLGLLAGFRRAYVLVRSTIRKPK